MRFLHLSDLHIGKVLNGFSMLEEQKNAFRQILDYIDSEKVQAVVIAGDVYDRAVPGVEAVAAFDDFLTDLTGRGVEILLISGNHDSPERLQFASRLLENQHLYIHSVYDGTFKPVTLSDTFGEINFWLLPFIKPATVRGFLRDREIESYTDAVSAVMRSAAFDETARNILVSHQFYVASGVIPERSDSEIQSVGGLDAVDIECLPPFDYVALGHLHGAQKIGKDTVRYAGSPVKYSFSEVKQEKSVNLVDIKEKGDCTIRKLKLTPIHDMRELRGTFDEVVSEDFVNSGDPEDYLRIILTDDIEILDPMERIRKIYPHTLDFRYDNKRSKIDLDDVTSDIDNAEKLSPYELFCEFFLKITGSTLSVEQSKIVTEMLSDSGEGNE